MKSLLVILFSLSVLPANAEKMTLDYTSFYSHVKKLSGDDTSALQFAFGFLHVQNKNLCHINSAHIHTQKQDIPLTISLEQRFTVPSEKALKLAKAQVIIDIEQPQNQCDMSVQIETKPQYLMESYSQNDLLFILKQYRSFFDEMGSFLSFLMPKAQGLLIHFSEHHLRGTSKVEVSSGEILHIDGGKLALTSDWLQNFKGQLNLPLVPVRITSINK